MATPRLASLILLFVAAILPDSDTQAGMLTHNASHWAYVGDSDGSERMYVGNTVSGVPFDWTVSASQRSLSAEGMFTTLVDSDVLMTDGTTSHSLLQTVQEYPTELFSEIGSGFWFTTDADVQVSLHGNMSFDLDVADPDYAAESSFVLDIFDGNQDQIYRGHWSSPFGLEAGMLLFDDSVVLDGGAIYFVEVHSSLGAFAQRFPGTQSTAVSDFTIKIATVPEPTSLALLCCAAWLASRTTGRRSCPHRRNHF